MRSAERSQDRTHIEQFVLSFNAAHIRAMLVEHILKHFTIFYRILINDNYWCLFEALY